MTVGRIQDLDPALQPLAIAFLIQCNAGLPDGCCVRMGRTWSSKADQQALFDKGLSHARPDFDCHCCVDDKGDPASKAFDFLCFTKEMVYITDGTHLAYATCGNIGKALGLSWGGDWTHTKPDFDHFNLASWVWGKSIEENLALQSNIT